MAIWQQIPRFVIKRSTTTKWKCEAIEDYRTDKVHELDLSIAHLSIYGSVSDTIYDFSSRAIEHSTIQPVICKLDSLVRFFAATATAAPFVQTRVIDGIITDYGVSRINGESGAPQIQTNKRITRRRQLRMRVTCSTLRTTRRGHWIVWSLTWLRPAITKLYHTGRVGISSSLH